jgi:predicted component of viral defense system (DUF524 family)
MQKLSQTEIQLDYIQEGLVLSVYAKKENTLFKADDASENSEAEIQLLEGHFYEYKFSDTAFSFEKHELIDESSYSSSQGRIVPNIYVGTLSFGVRKNGVDTGKQVSFEVQSVKASYRQDYRFMLESITEKCTELIMQAGSPVTHSFTTDYELDSKTLYQRFAFVKSVVSSDEFREAVQRIITLPATGWSVENEKTDVRRIRRFRSRELVQMINSENRIKLPDNHYLKKRGVPSVTMKINSDRKTESVDIPENRFIKYALESFLRFCYHIKSHKNLPERLVKETDEVISELESHLQHNLFRDISRPSVLKLNSPVLQRKEGYREILRSWLMFDLAARLIWEGGEDVYEGGKKDIATLYEYWLFFELLGLFSRMFNINHTDTDNLIQETDNGLGLQLKQGRHTVLRGIYKSEVRNLNIRFSYNRSFGSKRNSYPEPGSWTVTMRPDYTLTIWPGNLTEREAEKKEQIVHIHFDAKYKVEHLREIIDSEKEAELRLDQEKTENRKGVYKNADLLKMHAYKDAIRRTGGAYVLYPGDKPEILKGFHEIIPGLGAFPVRPVKDRESGIKYLEKFINEVISHFLNRASQRENTAEKIYRIHKNDPDILKEAVPEYAGGDKIIPGETFVLIGYYKSAEHLDWIKKQKLYNFRTGTGRGSLVLDEETVKAKYLLLHGEKENNSGRLYEIVSKGPKVFSKEDLLNLNYPDPGHDFYLVVEIKEAAPVFRKYKWNFRELKNYKTHRNAAFPFTASITELMKNIAEQT